MNLFSKILSSCVFLLVCGIALTGSAQAQIACPVPPPSPYRHDALISTRYDRAGDIMRTVLQHPRPLITDARSRRVFLAASFVHSGWPTPPPIELTLVSVSNAIHYSDRDALLISIGDTLMRFAPRYLTAPGGDGEIYEAVRATLTHRDLLEIINARTVSVRVGADEFTLTENHLEALRELASLMRSNMPSESDLFTFPDAQTR